MNANEITMRDAKRLYDHGNDHGCGYVPYGDEPGPDTIEAAVEAAAADGWTVLLDRNGSDQIMPDGRKWEEYRMDPLAGICEEPEARERAIAAWGEHSWDACPMHAAHGWRSIDEAPRDKRLAVAAFVALFDSHLLDRPEVAK